MALRKLEADEGFVYTDRATETMRAKIIYLGIEDSEDNYFQIPEDTPLPDEEVVV